MIESKYKEERHREREKKIIEKKKKRWTAKNREKGEIEVYKKGREREKVHR